MTPQLRLAAIYERSAATAEWFAAVALAAGIGNAAISLADAAARRAEAARLAAVAGLGDGRALLLAAPRCEQCGSGQDVTMRPALTAYVRKATPHEARRLHKLHLEQVLAAQAADLLGGEKCRYVIVPPLMYVHDEVANRSLSLCEECAFDYGSYWEERWTEYYHSR